MSSSRGKRARSESDDEGNGGGDSGGKGKGRGDAAGSLRKVARRDGRGGGGGGRRRSMLAVDITAVQDGAPPPLVSARRTRVGAAAYQASAGTGTDTAAASASASASAAAASGSVGGGAGGGAGAGSAEAGVQVGTVLRCVRGDKVIVSPTCVLEPGYVSISQAGTVEAVSSKPPPSLDAASIPSAPLVVPGFVDIHTHGVGGAEDVLDYWQHPRYTCSSVVRSGTTAVLATVVFPEAGTPDAARTQAALDAVAIFVGKSFPGCAVLEGIHAEGPFVADVGGLPSAPSYKDMSLADFRKFVDSIPALRVMTISPSLEAARKQPFDRLQYLCQRGVLPSLGHDRVATQHDILGALRAAKELGVRPLVTHLFNVTTFHHRKSGLTNLALLPKYPKLPEFAGLTPPTIELIGDTAHVSPATIALALAAKPVEDIVFITDAIAEPVAGKRVGYARRNVVVDKSAKHVCIEGSDVMAGSCGTLHGAFVELVQTHSRPFGDAVAMCSSNPARIAGLQHVGTLEVGRRADVVMMDDELAIQSVIVSGTVAAVP